MGDTGRVISHEQLDSLQAYCKDNAELLRARFGRAPKAYTVTFGCQQNEADTELITGMLYDMGFSIAPCAGEADLVLFNTCAIREHAETRVFGNVGETSHLKKAKPNVIICICGCMAQQPHIAARIKNSYPYVDILFGTHALHRFPQMLNSRLRGGKRVFDIEGDERGMIIEGVEPRREKGVRAWLSIMSGCNNYCSYCVVPHVRGRERCRTPEAVLSELKGLVASGYKDITLLGQNVNSYDGGGGCDFSELLRRADAIEGDFRLRFMTSHPKDAGERLFDTMAGCKKVCRSIHLPVQAGSDRVLESMNRRYTAEKYLRLIGYARDVMPDIAITSDIIVGFPGETEDDFERTIELLERVRFDSLFTFIYSKRRGTKAADMPDAFSREDKQARFDRLLDVQDKISREINDGFVGKTVRVLVDGFGGDPVYPLSARTDGFKLVHVDGPESLIGSYADVYIEKRSTWALMGRADCAERVED